MWQRKGEQHSGADQNLFQWKQQGLCHRGGRSQRDCSEGAGGGRYSGGDRQDGQTALGVSEEGGHFGRPHSLWDGGSGDQGGEPFL